jgi:hypothetical protein
MSTQEIATIAGLVLALIGLVITIIKEWHVIAPVVRVIRTKVMPSKQEWGTRRAFLVLTFGVGVVGIWQLAGPFGRFVTTIGIHLPEWITGATALPLNLVQNSRSGTIHHLDVCADHLPIPENGKQPTVAATLEQIHKHKKSAIAEVVAKGPNRAGAEALLLDAIRETPTATHLYRHLVGIWGEQKEYERIHRLLSSSIELLESEAASLSMLPKRSRLYARAIAELKARQRRAKFLAEMSRLG